MGFGERDIIVISDVEDFVVCPECGYQDGFHSVFEGLGKEGSAKRYLICPQCSSKYDLGLKA